MGSRRRLRRSPARVLGVLAALLVLAVFGVLAARSQDDGGQTATATRGFYNPPHAVLRPVSRPDDCVSGYPGTPQRPCATIVRGQYDTAGVTLSPDGRFLYSLSTYAGYRLGANGKPVDLPGGSIAAFRRDPRTGAIRQLPGADGCIRDAHAVINAVTRPCTRVARGIGGAKSMVISSNGRFAYVAGINNDAIAVFRRDLATGVLRQLPGRRACIQDRFYPRRDCQMKGNGLHGVRWVTLSPDGRNLYSASPANDAISAFSVNRRTGALRQLPGAAACVADHLARLDRSCQTHALAVNYPRSLAVSPDGKNVYVASDSADVTFPGDPADGNAVSVFQRDPRTGALSQLPGDAACIEDAVAARPKTDCPVKGAGLFQPIAVVVSPDGKNVYVGAGGSGRGAVASFARDPSTGALTQVQGASACLGGWEKCHPVPGLRGVGGLTVTPDGRDLYVAAFYGYTVAVLERDAGDGHLSEVSGGCVRDRQSPDRCPVTARGLNGPRNVVLSPDGRFAYVGSETSGAISVLAVKPGG